MQEARLYRLRTGRVVEETILTDENNVILAGDNYLPRSMVSYGTILPFARVLVGDYQILKVPTSHARGSPSYPPGSEVIICRASADRDIEELRLREVVSTSLLAPDAGNAILERYRAAVSESVCIVTELAGRYNPRIQGLRQERDREIDAIRRKYEPQINALKQEYEEEQRKIKKWRSLTEIVAAHARK